MTTRDELAQNPALQDELRRMQRGEPYDAHTPEMYAWRDEVKKLLRRLNITCFRITSSISWFLQCTCVVPRIWWTFVQSIPLYGWRLRGSFAWPIAPVATPSTALPAPKAQLAATAVEMDRNSLRVISCLTLKLSPFRSYPEADHSVFRS